MFQGVGHRLRGSANAVRIRAPQIGGEKVVLCNRELFLLLWLLVFSYVTFHSLCILNDLLAKGFVVFCWLEPSYFTESLMGKIYLPKTKIIH